VVRPAQGDQVGKVGCAGMIADEHLPTRSESTEAC